MLIFNTILDDRVILSRSAKDFENKYLGKSFDEKITIIRILDSKNEKFKLSKQYQEKIQVINIITAPEIEMLIICIEDKFAEFSKSNLKPSIFCKTKLKMPNVKNYTFVRN